MNKTITMPLEEYERLVAMQSEILYVSGWNEPQAERNGSFYFGAFCGAIIGFLACMIFLSV